MADLNIEKKPRSSVLPIIVILAAIGLVVWLFTQKDDSAQQQERTVGTRPQPVSIAPAAPTPQAALTM